jgi:hypothetical protein
MTGAERIAAERQRQIEIEGWDRLHDSQHTDGSLVYAAIRYAAQSRPDGANDDLRRMAWSYWGWHEDWWKPCDDPIRNLEKAGALIAAEIDRLLVVKEQKPSLIPESGVCGTKSKFEEQQ